MRRRAIILFVVAALSFCWVATGTVASAGEHHHARAVLGTAPAEGHLRVTATPKLPRDPSTGIANATVLIVALVIFGFLVVSALSPHRASQLRTMRSPRAPPSPRFV